MSTIRSLIVVFVSYAVLAMVVVVILATISAAPEMNKLSTTIITCVIVAIFGTVCAFISLSRGKKILGLTVSPWVADFFQGISTEMFGALIIILLFAFTIDRAGVALTR